MGSRYHLRTWSLLSLVLASGQLQIPLEQGEVHEHLEQDIVSLFGVIDSVNYFLPFHCFIIYAGTFDLRPSLEQRLMDHFSVPIYSVESKKGPLNHRYPVAQSMVIVLFSGLDDPTLAALNDTELSDGSLFFSFLYTPARNVSLTRDEIWDFFSWCWDRRFIRSLLFVRGQSEVDIWSYFHFKNITIVKINGKDTLRSNLQTKGYRFYIQVANDLPSIFWYNSSVQADVIGGGNISLSGPVGIMMVEFMRYLNASMDILPIKKSQSSNYEILEVPSHRKVDMAANLVANDSYLYSPIVTDSQICLVVPLRRQVPFNRYFDKAICPFYHLCLLVITVVVFGVKYMAHPHRSVMETAFSSLRFSMAIPLPGGQLNRLPLTDKIMEVYSFLFVGILIGAAVSILSTVLTTGVYYPPIRDVESMRASGLRIRTEDPTIKQAFEDNRMPSSLLDLVDLEDEETLFQDFVNLNDDYAYVVPTPNWKGFVMYQQRMFKKRFAISGPKLCSSTRFLRLPISPYSPLRFIFADYFNRVVESGLQQKWLQMAFQKLREVRGISKLPVDEATAWKPLNLDFFSVFIKIYTVGMLLSTLIFLIEILYKRFHG